jgi:hypothetical protein
VWCGVRGMPAFPGAPRHGGTAEVNATGNGVPGGEVPRGQQEALRRPRPERGEGAAGHDRGRTRDAGGSRGISRRDRPGRQHAVTGGGGRVAAAPPRLRGGTRRRYRATRAGPRRCRRSGDSGGRNPSVLTGARLRSPAGPTASTVAAAEPVGGTSTTGREPGAAPVGSGAGRLLSARRRQMTRALAPRMSLTGTRTHCCGHEHSCVRASAPM